MTSFREARDFLLEHRTDYERAVAGFRWPDPVPFNWAIHWFDGVLAREADSRDRAALTIVDTASGTDRSLTFAELSRRSNRVANWLSDLGATRGDHLLLVLGNVAPLWEVMLAAMKLELVVIPATTLLSRSELEDRLERGAARIVVAGIDQVEKFDGLPMPGVAKIAVGGRAGGWHAYEDADMGSDAFEPAGETRPGDPMLLYFTSGTTAKPKLVVHNHRSYPVGALSTMYWIGLQPGDVHLNISSPGWAKHAWSSVFAPWNAGATSLSINQPRFDAKGLLAEIVRRGVTTLCAPPTVWRMLIQEDLSAYPVQLREVVGAGEPLNPEVIERVKTAWGVTIRDGYGQTETTAQIGNTPGQRVKPGAMGRPLPGYRVRVLDPDGRDAREGEVALSLGEDRPAGLMDGYRQDDLTLKTPGETVYRTGDVAFLDEEGFFTFVGRSDDVFKSSDYRISPFELESVLIEHPAVAEAAIVPAPDPIRLAVPKAYVTLVSGHAPDASTARSILDHCGTRLSPFKRVRAVSFVSELPKTVSGKIRRVQLRRVETSGEGAEAFVVATFTEADLKGAPPPTGGDA